MGENWYFTKPHRYMKYFRDWRDDYIICSHVAEDTVERIHIHKDAYRACCQDCKNAGFMTATNLMIDPEYEAKGYFNVLKFNTNKPDVFEIVADDVSKYLWLGRKTAVYYLRKFQKIHGSQAIEKIHIFIKQSEESNKEFSWIMRNLGDDLCGNSKKRQALKTGMY